MHVALADHLAWARANRIAQEDAAQGRAREINSQLDPDGLGRLCVEYWTRDAALASIGRTLRDAEKDYVVSYRYHLRETGGSVSVVYALGRTEFDDPDKTPPGHRNARQS